jgi:hypothetical protein
MTGAAEPGGLAAPRADSCHSPGQYQPGETVNPAPCRRPVPRPDWRMPDVGGPGAGGQRDVRLPGAGFGAAETEWLVDQGGMARWRGRSDYSHAPGGGASSCSMVEVGRRFDSGGAPQARETGVSEGWGRRLVIEASFEVTGRTRSVFFW